MAILWLDFETRSRCDINARGAYNYAQDESTEVLCMSYAFDDGPVVCWDALTGDPFPDAVKKHIVSGGQIRAHNAAFERLIFWYVLRRTHGVPRPSLEQFYCTATQARCCAMPASLEDVGRAAGTGMRKDYRGAELIRKLCIPQKDGTFSADDDLLDELMAYCDQDVRTMREVSKTLRAMTPEEVADYHINERINDNGVLIDVELCHHAQRYATAELTEIQQLVVELTNGAVTSVRSPKMKEWVMARIGGEALEAMVVYKDGQKKYSIDKNIRATLLDMADTSPDQVPAVVADVIQCADDLWASSVAKFARAAAVADDEDHRARGALIFSGASATGRASSYSLQVHNFPRKSAKSPASVLDSMRVAAPLPGRVTDVLKSMLRPMIVPAPGNKLVVADWAGIEARGNPWLSGDPNAESVLDVFRKGDDIYITAANGIFHTNGRKGEDGDLIGISPEQRQIGKVSVLALGYAGGVNAFASMARNYGVALPEAQVEKIVKAWRSSNKWATAFWGHLNSAALCATRNKGHEFPAGRVSFLHRGGHLWCILPSRRILCYPFAVYDTKLECITYIKAAWKPSADAKEWPRARLYGGLLCENVTQAACNDILRHALRILTHDHKVILHVHDEIVIEAPEETAGAVKDSLCAVMRQPPGWADGFPLDVEAKIMDRYGK